MPNLALYRDSVLQMLNGQHSLPSLPSLTLEIRQAIINPDISHSALSQLITKDPSLSAVILKYASSPLQGLATPPTTLTAAISQLGINCVDNLLMGVTLI